MQFILLNAEQAATVRGETASLAALEPREIAAGQHQGEFVLPLAVLTDADHQVWHEYLSALPLVEIVPSEAWPPED